MGLPQVEKHHNKSMHILKLISYLKLNPSHISTLSPNIHNMVKPTTNRKGHTP